MTKAGQWSGVTAASMPEDSIFIEWRDESISRQLMQRAERIRQIKSSSRI